MKQKIFAGAISLALSFSSVAQAENAHRGEQEGPLNSDLSGMAADYMKQEPVKALESTACFVGKAAVATGSLGVCCAVGYMGGVATGFVASLPAAFLASMFGAGAIPIAIGVNAGGVVGTLAGAAVGLNVASKVMHDEIDYAETWKQSRENFFKAQKIVSEELKKHPELQDLGKPETWSRLTKEAQYAGGKVGGKLLKSLEDLLNNTMKKLGFSHKVSEKEVAAWVLNNKKINEACPVPSRS